MTDHEMLEMAAKAAGNVALIHNANTGEKYFGVVPNNKHCHEGTARWNPLTDDGDALRLAVKLDIEVEPVPFGGRAIVRDDDYGEQFDEESADRMAATRRAIVRAAAEIGKRTAAQEVGQ
ncbi:MAG TPA: hypothetical protein VIK69_02220 [Methylophilaceae bacterium]